MTKATGIEAVVKAVAGDECGCAERQRKLNALFPYAQPMTEVSKQVMRDVLIPAWGRGRMRAREQHAMMAVYEQVFGTRRQFSTCGSCIVEAYKKLKKAYDNQCDE